MLFLFARVTSWADMLAYPFSDHRDSVGSFTTNQGGIDLNVFEAVKQSVTTRQAAEHYGIHVGRNGMACCPFHNDRERQKSPSPGRNPRKNSFRKQTAAASVFLPTISICLWHGEKIMPRTPRRKPFIPGLWKPYRSKPKWNICWMCCCSGRRRKKRL